MGLGVAASCSETILDNIVSELDPDSFFLLLILVSVECWGSDSLLEYLEKADELGCQRIGLSRVTLSLKSLLLHLLKERSKGGEESNLHVQPQPKYSYSFFDIPVQHPCTQLSGWDPCSH